MEPAPRRSTAGPPQRDDDVRAVSRVAKVAVAAAVIGVGAFAGLAATGQTSASSALGGGSGRAAASDGGSSQDRGAAAGGGFLPDAQGYSDDGYSDDDGGVPSQQDFSAPQSAPSFSQGPPVAGSGGS